MKYFNGVGVLAVFALGVRAKLSWLSNVGVATSLKCLSSTMIMVIVVALVGCTRDVPSVSNKSGSLRLDASSDTSGGDHHDIKYAGKPALVTCISSTRAATPGVIPGCKIDGPGGSSTLAVSRMFHTNAAGNIVLHCTGRPPAQCSATVVW